MELWRLVHIKNDVIVDVKYYQDMTACIPYVNSFGVYRLDYAEKGYYSVSFRHIPDVITITAIHTEDNYD